LKTPLTISGFFKASAMKNNIKKADLFSEKYGIKGVPTFIVNGKYAVSGNREIGTKDLLNVVDFLIAKERKK
jgi:thiol:disulfide interchange protein DsbA